MRTDLLTPQGRQALKDFENAVKARTLATFAKTESAVREAETEYSSSKDKLLAHLMRQQRRITELTRTLKDAQVPLPHSKDARASKPKAPDASPKEVGRALSISRR